MLVVLRHKAAAAIMALAMFAGTADANTICEVRCAIEGATVPHSNLGSPTPTLSPAHHHHMAEEQKFRQHADQVPEISIQEPMCETYAQVVAFVNEPKLPSQGIDVSPVASFVISASDFQTVAIASGPDRSPPGIAVFNSSGLALRI